MAPLTSSVLHRIDSRWYESFKSCQINGTIVAEEKVEQLKSGVWKSGLAANVLHISSHSVDEPSSASLAGGSIVVPSPPWHSSVDATPPHGEGTMGLSLTSWSAYLSGSNLPSCHCSSNQDLPSSLFVPTLYPEEVMTTGMEKKTCRCKCL